MIVSPVMLRSSPEVSTRFSSSGRNASMALPSALAWTGMTMPTSGIWRLPSGRGSWWMITTSSMRSTPVRTASPVRRARSSAQGMARDLSSRVSR